jgi:hypothetical protein
MRKDLVLVDEEVQGELSAAVAKILTGAESIHGARKSSVDAGCKRHNSGASREGSKQTRTL